MQQCWLLHFQYTATIYFMSKIIQEWVLTLLVLKTCILSVQYTALPSSAANLPNSSALSISMHACVHKV
jgi:hypothetical protein